MTYAAVGVEETRVGARGKLVEELRDSGLLVCRAGELQ